MRCFYYRFADIKRSLLTCLLLAFGLSQMAGAAEPARPEAAFRTNELPMTDGRVEQVASHLTLKWEAKEEPEDDLFFELQQAESPEFRDPLVRYRGPDRASFLAGLPEGGHFFRVRTIDPARDEDSPDGAAGPWSAPLEVVIEYQSLAFAVTLFGIGAVVFLATLVLVVAGSIRARREEALEEESSDTPGR